MKVAETIPGGVFEEPMAAHFDKGRKRTEAEKLKKAIGDNRNACRSVDPAESRGQSRAADSGSVILPV